MPRCPAPGKQDHNAQMAALSMGEERTRPRQPKPPEPLSAEEVLLLTRTDRVDGPLADRHIRAIIPYTPSSKRYQAFRRAMSHRFSNFLGRSIWATDPKKACFSTCFLRVLYSIADILRPSEVQSADSECRTNRMTVSSPLRTCRSAQHLRCRRVCGGPRQLCPPDRLARLRACKNRALGPFGMGQPDLEFCRMG